MGVCFGACEISVLQTFTGVYGVGPASAKKWIRSGISCIADAIDSVDTLAKHDSRILAGTMTLCYVNKHSHTPCFLQAGCPSCRPTNSVKALKAQATKTQTKRQ